MNKVSVGVLATFVVILPPREAQVPAMGGLGRSSPRAHGVASRSGG